MKMFWPQIRDKLGYLLACNQTTTNSCVSVHIKSKGSFTLAMFVCDKARDIATWHHLPYLPWQIEIFLSVPKTSTVACRCCWRYHDNLRQWKHGLMALHAIISKYKHNHELFSCNWVFQWVTDKKSCWILIY